MKIPFNKPWISGQEFEYIRQAVQNGQLSGNGPFTRKCQDFFIERYDLKACFLTTSCTDALEMAAMLINIKPGDEVIMPSYTFVSTALAFARHGAIIRFVDCGKDRPGMEEDFIEALINKKTRAIVPVHYAGISCDMDKIMHLAKKYKIYVVEDAAHAVESNYKGKQLGTIGHLGCYSFHETKNIHCGEGGMLAVNESRFINRAEIIWEKGTNRSQFLRRDTDHYEWKDIGSSFLPSEISAAFLLAQAESIDIIQRRRIHIRDLYLDAFREIHEKGIIKIPFGSVSDSNNGNSFFILCKNISQRDGLIEHLRQAGVIVQSHYLPLHKSEYYLPFHDGRQLKSSEIISNTLIRFPLYYELKDDMVKFITVKAIEFLCDA